MREWSSSEICGPRVRSFCSERNRPKDRTIPLSSHNNLSEQHNITSEHLENIGMASQEDTGAAPPVDKETDQLKLVVERLKPHCTKGSPHKDLQLIAAALEQGDSLTGKVLSGGVTNVSFKIYLEKNPDLKVFAKLCFSTPGWSPAGTTEKFDVGRQQVEFDLMDRFSKIVDPDGKRHVVVPYLLLNVDQDTRIIISQWALADEQWGNQFIEGEIDPRVMSKIGPFFAKVTLARGVDPELNLTSKKNLQNMLGSFFSAFSGLFFTNMDQEPRDDAVTYIREIGSDMFAKVMTAFGVAEVDCREVLCHGDSHCFNILVEKKPDISHLESFGPNGELYVIDWELAHMGMPGKDIGLFHAWPMACAFCFVAKGQVETAHNIMTGLRGVWNDYVKALVEEGGKDDDFLLKAFRGVLVYVGEYLFYVFYCMGLFNEFMDFEGLSETDTQKVKGAMGKVGAIFLEWGLIKTADASQTFTLDGLIETFDKTVAEGFDSLKDVVQGYRAHPHGSSMLRASGRRVSDSMILEGTIRLASHHISEGINED